MENNADQPTIMSFAHALIVLFISCFLILKQPDLGTSIIVGLSGLILLYLSGLPLKFYLYLMLIFSISAPLLWKTLKPYQKKRIEVFLGAGDSKKERYQIEQSQIAIGSGGLYGKGYLQGTQNKLLFLPESRTDFIFAVVCEEWGFLGALSLIMLYALLCMRLCYVVTTIKNYYAQILASGLIIHIMLSAVINIAMVIGLLPIVGIPLPFMSYGISHTWISYASLGWFNSIAMRRFYLSVSTSLLTTTKIIYSKPS
jgi:rod shape determining protein RodA